MVKNMKISVAMISPFFCRCGIASYSKALSEALSKNGCEVYGVRLPRFGSKTPAILTDVIERIPLSEVSLIHLQHEYGLYQQGEATVYTLLAKLKKPVVTTMHAVGNWQIDGGISRFSARVIVHNEFCARKFGFPTTIIPHGCKPVKCPPKDECKRNLGIPPEAPVVGYCGFISPYKGLETLFEAMENVRAGLLIGGGWHTVGPETEYINHLKNVSGSLKGRCQWLGYVPDDQLSTAYGAMDVVAYPSRWATESGALLNALSHGKAVVASNVAPFREKAKVGALMTFKSASDLARKIKRLIKDGQLREKLEEGARRYANSVKWFPNIAERHINLYKYVIEYEKN